MDHEFHFKPDFGHVESFLKFYQVQHTSNVEIVLKLEVAADYFTTMPGYPDPTRNAWITLRYAVEQMNQSFYNKKSQVQIEVVLS